MAEILEIDADTVLIDGSDIDFEGEAGGPRIGQLAQVLVANEGGDIAISQFASLSVQKPPPSPSRISQYVVISVIANGRKSICLGPPIKLDCWQPCTAYGTTGLIVYLGG